MEWSEVVQMGGEDEECGRRGCGVEVLWKTRSGYQAEENASALSTYRKHSLRRNDREKS